MRQIDSLIIHCTATRPQWMKASATTTKVATVRRWHVQGNGWSDIGYHYLIDRDGYALAGRPLKRIGAHCRGENRTSIGVALFGGHGASAKDLFHDHFTDQQETALLNRLYFLHHNYGPITVSGHNEHAAKGCPGFNVPKWLALHNLTPDLDFID